MNLPGLVPLHCPSSCSVFAMYWVGTLDLAPSVKKSKAFGVVEVRNAGDVVGDSFSCVLWNMVLEKAFLNEILESFVGEVDAELVEGIGRAGHVLWSREIE